MNVFAEEGSSIPHVLSAVSAKEVCTQIGTQSGPTRVLETLDNGNSFTNDRPAAGGRCRDGTMTSAVRRGDIVIVMGMMRQLTADSLQV
ncbi:hypothetical protein J6590_021513 [Homalodisca vitripennis]|nr:hypothetical protein J6590_021513 [Homalodisca vitripennis]